MSLVFNAKTYTANSFGSNFVGYIGAAKTASVKDDVKILSTQPKPTETFSGMSRTQSKLSRTLTLTGAKTTAGDAIITIDVAIPVGFAGADVDALLNDFGALLASATYKTIVKSQQISY